MAARKQYTIDLFHTHELQWLVALFCTKPELYKDHQQYKFKQDYFFERFRRFAVDYYNFSGDECIYFGTVRKATAGETSICGGGGRMSGSSSRYFKGRYHAIEEAREKRIDEFAKKYGVCFAVGTDPRLFLGVTEIWNKLDQIEEILAASKWADVKERAYEDESFATPFPTKLEKDLVPLEIRNKTMQKYRASRSSSIVAKKTVEEEEEESPSTKTANSNNVVQIRIVIPTFEDDEW